MSSFLTGVRTKEDFENVLRDWSKYWYLAAPLRNLLTHPVTAIDEKSKPQSPPRKRGLEDDGSLPADSSPDHRPNKQHKRSSSDSSPVHGPKKKAASRVRPNNGHMEWLDESDAQWSRHTSYD